MGSIMTAAYVSKGLALSEWRAESADAKYVIGLYPSTGGDMEDRQAGPKPAFGQKAFSKSPGAKLL